MGTEAKEEEKKYRLKERKAYAARASSLEIYSNLSNPKVSLSYTDHNY